MTAHLLLVVWRLSIETTAPPGSVREKDLGDCSGDDVLLELLDKPRLREVVQQLAEAVDRFGVKVLQKRRGDVAVYLKEGAFCEALLYPRDLLS